MATKPKAKKRMRLRDPATPWLEAEDGPLYDGALADWEIERAVRREDGDPLRLVIHPFHGEQRKTLGTDTRPKSKGRDGRPHGNPNRTVSYGLSCKGYDVRLGNTFRRRTSRPFSPVVDLFGDPAQLDRWETPVSEDWGRRVWLEAGECVLAETVETVRVPEDCVVIVLCKSTWAREFLHLNTTPLEPGWQSTITLELKNLNDRPLAVYPGHGIGQLVFIRGGRAAVPYHLRPGGGTYQNQAGPTPAKV